MIATIPSVFLNILQLVSTTILRRRRIVYILHYLRPVSTTPHGELEAPFIRRSTRNALDLSSCSPRSHLHGLLRCRELHERQALASEGVVHDLDVYGRRAHALLKELHQVALWEALHALERHRAALETKK